MNKNGITLIGIRERLSSYLMPTEKSALGDYEAEIASLKEKLNQQIEYERHLNAVIFKRDNTVTRRNTQIADLRGQIKELTKSHKSLEDMIIAMKEQAKEVLCYKAECTNRE